MYLSPEISKLVIENMKTFAANRSAATNLPWTCATTCKSSPKKSIPGISPPT